MNLITKMNIVEISIQNTFYEFITKFFDTMEKYTNILDTLILNGFEDDIKLIKDENDIKNIVEKFCTIDNKTVININPKSNNKRKLDLNKYNSKICDMYIDLTSNYINKMLNDNCLPFIKSRRDLDLINKRRLFLLNKYNKTFISLSNELFNDFLNDMILFMKDYLLDIVSNEQLDNINDIPDENIIIEKKVARTVHNRLLLLNDRRKAKDQIKEIENILAFNFHILGI
jgi:hypothetical protein